MIKAIILIILWVILCVIVERNWKTKNKQSDGWQNLWKERLRK